MVDPKFPIKRFKIEAETAGHVTLTNYIFNSPLIFVCVSGIFVYIFVYDFFTIAVIKLLE